MKKLSLLILTVLLPLVAFATVIYENDFNADPTDWATVSVSGPQEWNHSDTYGVDNSGCMKMSGYDSSVSAAVVNEDWLISPAFDLTGNTAVLLSFQTAMNYTGNAMEAMITTNYTGNPATTSWDDVDATMSAGAWSWTPSGDLDILEYASATTVVAFKFTCDDSGSATWEIDEFKIATEGGTVEPPVDDLFSQDFNVEPTDWTTFSVTGTKEWNHSDSYGVNNSGCMKMSGYDSVAQTTEINEDWLISPAYDLSAQDEVFLAFQTAMNYTGNTMEAMITTNYTGDPTTTSWDDVDATLSSGSWSWTESGDIDISEYISATTVVAFKFTCDDVASSTWEVDEFKILAEGGTVEPPEDDIYAQDFNAEPTDWTKVSVLGAQEWTHSTAYGVNNSGCMKMSGYDSANSVTVINEDWYVSPVFDLSAQTEVLLAFQTAMNYTGNAMEAMITTNYTGDPTTTSWDDIDATMSAGAWAWTESGNIDISEYISTTTTIAFKYTCNDVESATWEIDEFKLMADGGTVDPPEDILFAQDFNVEPADWNTVSVTGVKEWNHSATYGVDNSGCMKMSGFDSTAMLTETNEDWLVSPAYDLSAQDEVFLAFQTAMNYTGNTMEAMITTNYTGDPTTTSWDDVDATLSTGSWAWTESGDIDISAYISTTTVVAFKFTCDDVASSTWEVDDFKLMSEGGSVVDPPDPTAVWTADFETAEPTDWIKVSVLGTQEWEYDDHHGVAGSACMKVSGYNGTPGESDINEDWYISPAVDLSALTHPAVSFMTAMNYTGGAFEAMVTTNYTGDPSTTAWEMLNAELSTGSWAWTHSGYIMIPSHISTTTRVAFKYTCTEGGSSTWEIDDVKFIDGTTDTHDNTAVPSLMPVIANYPNPFNPSTTISYTTMAAGHVSIDVYNVRGQKVINLLNERKLAGSDTVNWNGFDANNKSVASGVYFYRITTNNGTVSNKMLLLK